MRLNPPILVPYVEAGLSAKELETKINELYKSGNLKEDCAQVKIRISVEVEVCSER